MVRTQFWTLNPHHPMQFSVIHRTDQWQWRVLYTELHRVWGHSLELWILTTRCSLVSYTVLYTGQSNGNERVLYTDLNLVVRTQFWSFESSPPDAVSCHTQDRLMAMNGYSTLNCIGWWGHSSGALNPHHPMQLHWTVSYTEYTQNPHHPMQFNGNGNERVLYTELHRVVRTQFWSFESSPPDAVQCHTQNSLMAMNGYSTLNCIWWLGYSSGALDPRHPIQFSVIYRTCSSFVIWLYQSFSLIVYKILVTTWMSIYLS